jgi:hypothetical protein
MASSCDGYSLQESYQAALTLEQRPRLPHDLPPQFSGFPILFFALPFVLLALEPASLGTQ